MDWYQIAIAAITVIALLWGGWKLAKRVPREIGEAFIEIADAVEDDQITREELHAIVARFYKVLVTLQQIKTPSLAPGSFADWLVSLFSKKPKPVEFLPTSTKQVDGSVIQQIIREKFPEGELYLSDATKYLLCSYDDIALFLAQDKTNRLDYVKEKFDCDDFALRLVGQFSIPEWSELAIGLMWTEKHALTCFITDDEKLLFIEPQSDEIQDELADWQGKTNRFIIL